MTLWRAWWGRELKKAAEMISAAFVL